MTVLVSVLAQDGVVIGADSGATFGALGQSTVMLAATKIDTLGGRALIATSGPVGLGQRFATEFGHMLDTAPPSPPGPSAMVNIAALFRPHVQLEAKAAQGFIPLLGNEAARSVLSQTVVAVCMDKQPYLFQFDHQGAPEEATVGLPFVTLGSGQTLADPFMAFLSDILWPSGQLPTLGQATLATIWTLDQAIKVAPSGLMKPARVFVLEAKGGKCASREMTEPDLAEHRQQIADMTGLLKDYKPTTTAPPPPQPPGVAPAPTTAASRRERRGAVRAARSSE